MTTIYNNINDKDKKLLKKTIINEEDPLWYNDISILFVYNRLTEFFPSSDMTIEEQLNSIVRLCLYISFVLLLYTSNANVLLLFLFSLVFTYLIYKYSDKNNNLEKYENYNSKFVSPTVNNPFMNVMLNDYKDNPNRESLNKANNYINKKINHEIANKYNYNLYKDSNDIFDRNTTQRQFYTMPVTTIPNRQDHFSKYETLFKILL